MTNDTQNPNVGAAKTREVWNVTVSFWVPMEGMVPIAAATEDEAKIIATKMFDKRKDLVIVDCYNLEDVEGLDEEDLMTIKENVLN